MTAASYVAGAGHILVTFQLEVARAGVSTLCGLGFVRGDGHRFRVAQEEPIPELEPGVYAFELAVPLEAISEGDYVVEARVKVRWSGKKGLIGRLGALQLQVEAGSIQSSRTGAGRSERFEGDDDAPDSIPPVAVGWSVLRLSD